MTDTHTEALDPCPFCAAKDAFSERADFSSSYVVCNNCLARGPVQCQDDDDEEEPGQASAIAAWNTRAAIEALPARNDERALKLVEAVRPFAEACDECVDDRDGDQVSIWEHGAAMQIEFRHLRAARDAYQAALADTQPSQDQS